MDHDSLIDQFNALVPLILGFGFPAPILHNDQTLHFGEHAAGVQGKGLRAILPILAATTDRKIRFLLIDEPETALEPRLQKQLRDHLQSWAGDSRAVVVATHSHLFLNREDPRNNYVVAREGGHIAARRVLSAAALGDLTFRLLGNSVEDLFFPGNFLIVEGSSDQTILERVLDLLGTRTGAVKVFAARGITEVGPAMSAILRTLTPLVADSPYRERVVCIVDQPANEAEQKKVADIQKHLGDRCVVLNERSIEAVVGDGIYGRVGLKRAEEIERLEHLRGDRTALFQRKKELSQLIAGALVEEDLGDLPQLVDAAKRAIAGAPAS